MSHTREKLQAMGLMELRRLAHQVAGLSLWQCAEMSSDDITEAILGAVDDTSGLKKFMTYEAIKNLTPEQRQAQFELYRDQPVWKQNWIKDLLTQIPGRTVEWALRFIEIKQRLRMASPSFNLVCRDGGVYLWIKSRSMLNLDSFEVLGDLILERGQPFLEPALPVVNGEIITDTMRTIFHTTTNQWEWVADILNRAKLGDWERGYAAAKKLSVAKLLERRKNKSGRVEYRVKDGAELPPPYKGNFLGASSVERS